MKNIILLSLITLSFLSSSVVFSADAAGDAVNGKTSYMICAACHGVKGEGNQMMNGPRLAGQDVWYITSSLKRFKSGARGKDDPIAASMIPMAKMLTEKQIEDVAAYIATL
jgi:cytochrome c oxidase subunit 2